MGKRKTRQLRTRRIRRAFKASMLHPGAKPRHKLISGRTGAVHSKKLQSGRHED